MQAIIGKVDRALRVLAVAALRQAGLAEHAEMVGRLPPLTVANARYACDVVHFAFVAARKLAHVAAAKGGEPIAELAATAACCAHACADACAAIGHATSPSGGLFLSMADRTAGLAEGHARALGIS